MVKHCKQPTQVGTYTTVNEQIIRIRIIIIIMGNN